MQAMAEAKTCLAAQESTVAVRDIMLFLVSKREKKQPSLRQQQVGERTLQKDEKLREKKKINVTASQKNLSQSKFIRL